MFDVKHLRNLIEILEEPKNIYGRAVYKSLIKTCTIAEVMVLALWEGGELGDNERLNLSERIEKAKENIIKKNKECIKKTLSAISFGDTETLIDTLLEMVF